MKPESHSARRNRMQARPQGEHLESRSLLTGGGGNIFALVPGQVAAPGGTSAQTFTIDPTHFIAPRKSVLLGVDVAPMTGSAVKPVIKGVQTGAETATASTGAQPRSMPLKTQRTASNSAVLVTIKTSKQPAQFTTTVSSDKGTTGSYVLGYYLPGDTDGDGFVSQQDLLAIAKDMGQTVSGSSYTFDADANRDGRIDTRDLALAKQNLGVKTDITPAITANLDPISDSGVADRTTVYQDAIFNGEGSPGAKISYSEVDGKVPVATTTVGPDGKYELTIPLAEGGNNFKVTSVDGFGQSISGKIAAVVYEKPAVPVTSPVKPPITTTTGDPAKPPTGQTDTSTVPPRYASWIKAHPDQAAKLRERLAAQQTRTPAPSTKSS